MRSFFIGSLAFVVSGLLVGCGGTPSPTATSYGYHSAPKAQAYTQPSRFSSLPAHTEAASQTESVQGFPPGHPLHQDNNYQQDETASHQADENALPHADYNY